MLRTLESVTYEFGGDLFIDIGGNIGQWTKELYNDYSKIIFIEPSLSAFEEARIGIKGHTEYWNLSNPKDKITYINKLVLGESGQKKSIYSVTGDTGNFTIFGDQLYEESEIKKVETDIDSITLDDLIPFVNRNNSKTITVKIDTEGCELDIILGGQKFIETFKPTLIVEMHRHMNYGQEKFDQVINFLYSNGYNIKQFFFATYIDNPTMQFDKNYTGIELASLHYQFLITQ